MPPLESLAQIRILWIDRVTHRLARGENLRDSVRDQLGQFYNRMTQAVEMGDPAWLNPIINEWVQARTVTELEDTHTSLSPVFAQMLTSTYEVAIETLDSVSALELIGVLLPVYTYLFGYASHLETRLRVDHISIELEAAHNVLERLDKSKSDFIAIAAHELKTPLTLIEGYSAMLTEQLQQDPQHADTMLAGIGNGTRRLREIIDDMIDVSLIDNNLLSLNFQPVWLNRLLVIIQQEIQETISTRQILFSLTPFPGWDQMFFGDSERLYQALRNIISNAVKFTPDGGRISVEGRELPGFLEVRVSDTGIGIAPENQSQIFEKFGRLGNPSLHSSGKTKFKGGGPGLGLPIARGIVEAHGGTIWVESAGYDEIQFPGATFHILLPLRQEPPDKKIARLFSVPSSASAVEHKHIE
jgi:signal transduction histidine kinase